MDKEARLDYFYGTQGEQFQFLQVPIVFFTDPFYSELDCDEIMLYSHMLRRISLSRKNGWLDSLNRVYIRYSQKEAREDIRRGKDKVLEAYKTLERHGLIERIDMGIGKADMIYVKDFTKLLGEDDSGAEKPHQDVDNYVPDTEKTSRDVDNSASDTAFQMPWGRKIRLEGFGKTESSYKENNKTDGDTGSYHHSSSNFCKISTAQESREDKTDRKTKAYVNDMTDDYISLIQKNIGYPDMCDTLGSLDGQIFENMYRVICDTVCSKIPDDSYITIGKEQKPFKLVKDVFLKLKYEHLEQAIMNIDRSRKPVTDMKQYLKTILYNSYLTMDTQISQDLKSSGII